MTNMTDQEQSNTQSSAILRELSDIKSTLAVNTNETVNIKGSLAEMKQDVKEIKSDFMTRREFNDASKAIRDEIPKKLVEDHEIRLRAVETRMNWSIGVQAVVQLVIIPVILWYFFNSLKPE